MTHNKEKKPLNILMPAGSVWKPKGGSHRADQEGPWLHTGWKSNVSLENETVYWIAWATETTRWSVLKTQKREKKCVSLLLG